MQIGRGQSCLLSNMNGQQCEIVRVCMALRIANQDVPLLISTAPRHSARIWFSFFSRLLGPVVMAAPLASRPFKRSYSFLMDLIVYMRYRIFLLFRIGYCESLTHAGFFFSCIRVSLTRKQKHD